MTKRIAMWSGPRNISTAMMRSFEARGDTFVSDEPMYGHFLETTQINHPMKDEVIQSMETDREKLRGYLTSHNPSDYSIWYQKQMTQHILDDDDLYWTLDLDNAFLIRDPRSVILSYLKKFDIENESLIGFLQLERIFDFVKGNSNKKIIVVDAEDILAKPPITLNLLCRALDIKFTDNMLTWEKGYRQTDGIWGAHWYDSVINTTGFIRTPKNKGEIPPKYKKVYDRSMDIYQKLSEYSIKIK